MFREEPRMWGRFLHRGLVRGSRGKEVQWGLGAWELRDQDGVAALDILKILFICLLVTPCSMWTQFFDQGSNLCPHTLKGGVSTTGPPGKTPRQC